MDFDELLRRQAGVTSRAQALSCGIPPRTIGRRVSDGRWRVLLPGVYLVSGHRETDEVHVRAAWLWLGEDALVSGTSAAYWFGMLDAPGPTVHVTVPPMAHRRPRRGVVIHRRAIDPRDVARPRGIALTSRARAPLETAAELDDGAAFLDRALQRHVSFTQVSAAYSRMIGTHGSARAGRLLAAVADRADSQAERLLLRILRRAGIEGWVVGHPFGAWTLDLAFPEQRLAIEFDSWAWHVDRPRFVNDRAKGNALVTSGWTILRFTWTDVAEHPERTLATLQKAFKEGHDHRFRPIEAVYGLDGSGTVI